MTIKANAASVTFENVVKKFGSVTAVNDVSVTVEPGTLVTLLGPSGCGKTTMLRLVAGLEMATAGRILIGERDVTRLPATDRDVSMVFQSYALFPHMSVIENVAYGLTVSGINKEDCRVRAHDGLDLVGLKGLGDRLPSELSGGQQQRVAVARALVLEPQVLLFDEPLSNLDAKLRRRVREEIRDIQKSLDLTSIYVTHDQEEALAVSDRIIVMNEAVIAQEGSPHELYESPADLFVADFIGDANVIDAEITAVDGPTATVLFGQASLALPHRNLTIGPVHLAIRPESILLSEAATKDGVEGRVLKTTYLGDHMEYTVATALGELFVISADVSAPIAPDVPVWVTLSDHGVIPIGLTTSAS